MDASFGQVALRFSPLLVLAAALLVRAVPPNLNTVEYNLTPRAAPAPDAANDPLQRALRSGTVNVTPMDRPEGFTQDAQGRVYTGLANGTIVRFRVDENGHVADLEHFAHTGRRHEDCDNPGHLRSCGRPLGLSFDADGYMYVGDAGLGLLRATPDGKQVVTVITYVDGRPLMFTNGVAVHPRTGIVYFTESSTLFSIHELVLDTLMGTGNGFLAAYDPVTQQTKILKSRVRFANGVVISHDEKSVLFASTMELAIYKYDIESGKTSVVAKDLFFTPDNISRRPNGKTYWAAGLPVSPLSSVLGPFPSLRWLLAKVPLWLLAKFVPTESYIVEFDEAGNILTVMQDASGAFQQASELYEVNGHAFVGSFGVQRLQSFPLA